MNRMPIKLILSVLVFGSLTAIAGYWFARSNASSTSMQATASTDHKALYWYDPMVPNQHFDHPGKSPFMDMQLVAKYADEGGQDAMAQPGIHIDASAAQNLGLRLTTVQRGVVAQPMIVPGNLGFNQRDVAIVQARTNGFVERVYQRAPGDVIERDAPLVDVLVPEWSGAQAEFIALLKSHDQALIGAARQRMRLLGMSDELIADVEQHQQPLTTITIRSPIAGVVDSLDVRAAMNISTGMTLATIKGLGTVWLEAQLPEAQSARVKLGAAVTAMLTAYPGEVFKGKVIAILPEATVETRTMRVRVELQNAMQRLRPGMFAQVTLDTGQSTPQLFIPAEALIRSGTRNMVITRTDAGQFMPVEVQLGSESDGKAIIVTGLTEGQQVVASGQFLIDSEANLQGTLTQLNEGSALPTQPAGSTP